MVLVSSSASSANADDARLLVWLGPPFFAQHAKALGWNLVLRDHDPLHPWDWQDILALTGGETPDVLVVADASTPPPVLGVEAFPCLTLFYSIDAHIHSWHPLYGQGFDLCLVSLHEHLANFAKGRLEQTRVLWLPPYAKDEDRPPEEEVPKEWDLLFVGTVNPDRAPARHAFLMEAQRLFPSLHIMTGDFRTTYPKARLVLNECTHGELNFRVFEALGCGACLLTPDIGPALSELFCCGQELFCYPSRDAAAMASLAVSLLDNETLRQRVALAGLAAVDARHRASHRAAGLFSSLQELLRSGEAEHLIRQRLRIAGDIHRDILRLVYLLHAESIDIPELRLEYARAARQLP